MCVYLYTYVWYVWHVLYTPMHQTRTARFGATASLLPPPALAPPPPAMLLQIDTKAAS